MTAIRYSQSKLLLYASFIALPAVFTTWMLVAPGKFLAYQGWSAAIVHFVAANVWLSSALFAITAFVSFKAFRLALGDRNALAARESGVEVRTLFRLHRFGWDEIAGIDATPGTAMRGATLIVRVRRGAGEKKFAIFTGLLEQSAGEVARLLEAPAWRRRVAADG